MTCLPTNLAEIIDDAQLGHGQLILNDPLSRDGGYEKDIDLSFFLHWQRERKIAEGVECHRHLIGKMEIATVVRSVHSINRLLQLLLKWARN